MRRKFVVLMIVLLVFAVGCGSDNGTPGPAQEDAAPDVNATPTVDESPRIGPDAELPPTWTPAATNAAATPQTAGEEGPAGGTEGQETYTVQAGDTLAEIAAAFGVTLDALAAANNITNVDVIEVDQVLIIPR
jgi:LysM repeat protein